MPLDVTRRDVAWSYANLGLTNAVNLLLLPLLLFALTPSEVGLWFVFSAIGALVVVLDMGLMTTFSRQISFVWCGAAELHRVGFVPNDRPDHPNFRLLRQLLATLRVAYFAIAVVALVAAGTLGTWHVLQSLDNSIPRDRALAAWVVYLTAIVLNMAFSYWAPVLRGIGDVAESHQANVVGKVLQLVLTALLLGLGLGLVGVCLAYLASTFAARLTAVWFFTSHEGVGAALAEVDRPSGQRIREILLLLWPLSAKQGLVSVSQYVLTSAPVLVSSALLNLEVAATVGLTAQLINLIRVFSNGLFNAYLPLFSRLRLEGNRTALLDRFARSLGVSTYLTLVGGFLMVIVANPVLSWIGSDVLILPWNVALLYVVTECLINQTALSSGFVATGNTVPMHVAYVLTASTTVLLQVLLTGVFEWGVWGIVVPGFATFSAYNGWAWFLRVSRDLEVGVPTLLRCVVVCSAGPAIRKET